MRDWEHYYQLEQAIRAIGELMLRMAEHIGEQLEHIAHTDSDTKETPHDPR